MSQKRNLIVLGRTGVGKSTVVNQFFGKDVFPVSTSMKGVTRERRTSEEETEIKTEDAKGEVEYKIKMIDTVGVRDDVAQRGKEIVDEINDYLSRIAPEGVNLILFIMRKGIYSEEEKHTFHSIIASFENAKEISAFIVTGCEGLSEEGREEEISAIKRGENTKSLTELMGKGVHAVGFPDVQDVLEALKKVYKEGIKTDAEKLRQFVLNSEVMKHLKITRKRNLIVLGRTGVGKSTVVKQMLGEDVFKVNTSMEGVTRRRRTSEEETEIETKDAKREVEYKIKMIDTVGVRDDVAKRDKEIVDEIQHYLSRKAPEGVNLFLFVIRKDRFSKEEKQIFRNIIQSFQKKVKKISALIITGCEGLDENDRRQVVFETRNGDEETEFLAEFMGRDIHPVGFPSVDKLDKLTQPLREEYEEGIRKDAEELRSVVLSSGMMSLKQDIIKDEHRVESSCCLQ